MGDSWDRRQAELDRVDAAFHQDVVDQMPGAGEPRNDLLDQIGVRFRYEYCEFTVPLYDQIRAMNDAGRRGWRRVDAVPDRTVTGQLSGTVWIVMEREVPR